MSNANGQKVDTPERNEEFQHNPKIEEFNRKLDKIDKRRLAEIKKAKDEARPIKEERDMLMMEEQITLRILTDSPLSVRETAWIEANPKNWKAIKAATQGKRGSRRGQIVKAGPQS